MEVTASLTHWKSRKEPGLPENLRNALPETGKDIRLLGIANCMFYVRKICPSVNAYVGCQYSSFYHCGSMMIDKMCLQGIATDTLSL